MIIIAAENESDRIALLTLQETVSDLSSSFCHLYN